MHDGTTPLMLAVRLAVEGMVEELINADADVNATDAQGNVISSSSSSSSSSSCCSHCWPLKVKVRSFELALRQCHLV